MSWSAPHILWYLPLALLPVIIYYWMRRHPMRCPWGAHYVLARAMQRLKRKIINEHLILLVVRVLVALLLIVAFARLIWGGGGEGQVVHSGVHRVIILDASYSMLAGDTGRTRWDTAQAALQRLLKTWGRGESWSLYAMNDKPGWLVEYAVIGEGPTFEQLAPSLRPCESPASLAKALRATRERFPLKNIDLFLFTDDQAQTWRDVADVLGPDRPRHTYWLNPPIASHANTAVTRVRVACERALRVHPTRVFASLKHFSDAPQDVKVEFLQDGEVVGSETVSLQPGLDGETFFDAQFDSSGPHRVSVRLAPDILHYDDIQTAGMEVVDGVEVLVLRDENCEPWRTTWDVFTQIALLQDVLKVERAHVVFSLHDGACTAANLAGMDVVFVDAGKTVDDDLAALLAGFVRRGGGLVLAPGVGVDKDRWNKVWRAAGLLPAELGDAPEWKFDPGTPNYKCAANSGFGDVAFKAFAGEEAGRLQEAQFFHWYDLVPGPGGLRPQDILLRFDDHRPLLARRQVGLGRVLLLASGLNGIDNTLPVRETFTPLLYRLFREAAAGRIFPRTLATGQPVRYRIEAPDSLDALALEFEGEPAAIPMAMEKIEGVSAGVVAAGIRHSGLGKIRSVIGGRVRTAYVGVQGSCADSDLAPLADALRTQYVNQWHMTRAADADALIRAALAGRGGHELYSALLALALLFMLAELAYQRRFTRAGP